MSGTSSRETSRSPSDSLGSTNATEPSSLGYFEIKSSASKSSFKRWRPTYHFQAPSGWMNDPCAPFYDPSTDLYHVSYQSSLDLKNADWGEIAWRSAISSDLVTWHHEHQPALRPDTAYDGKGVFTGCKVPSRDNSLTYVYTSVSALPIHHTLPHVKGSESLSMAKSLDGGRTWEKCSKNPILPCEPDKFEVTGWRDPYVSAWPSLAAALGTDPEKSLFGIISGGIRKVTPTTFLYSVDADNLADWRYIGPLVDFGLNLRPSKWSGDMGKNWEVTNFATLRDPNDQSISRDFLAMGTEGCLESAVSPVAPSKPPTGPSRPLRNQLWMSGSLIKNKTLDSPAYSPVQMKFGFGGHLDHGCLYAANSFFDSKTSKHIVWGWITEEDLCDELRQEQGWSGLLSLPREIHLQTISNVSSARVSDLRNITSLEVETDVRGTHTIRTLASEPVDSVVQCLRQHAIVRRARLSRPLPRRSSFDLAFNSDDVKTTAWELDCSFSVSKRCHDIGVQIVHFRDFTKTTTLSFSPPTETFTIDRPSLSKTCHQLINARPEIAPHTLFTTIDPEGSGLEVEEPLRIRVWRDNSVLEVFVNDRTAISTRLYAAEETIGIRFFAEDTPMLCPSFSDHCSANALAESSLMSATLWDGLSA